MLRDERLVSALIQLGVAALVLALLVAGARSVTGDLRARGLAPGIDFLQYEAGFGIGEGPAFSETDSMWRAFVVGLANTLRIAVAGVALATVVGLGAALARLSGNPVVSRLAGLYVDVFRNTPVVVQLYFWYRGVILRLPQLGDASELRLPLTGGEPVAFLSRRGLAVPAVSFGAEGWNWVAVVVAGAAVAVAAARWRSGVQASTGKPAHAGLWAALIVASAAAAASVAFPGALALELPEKVRFGYVRGTTLSPEFAALLGGLVAYTGAFIAEVIRSGIQSVPRGQREAGLAAGLREGQLLRLVVLPQALRVIVPPLTSQYLNLTKNSSLAIAIGYPDLFFVGRTISNNTGQAVVVIAMIMAVYLGISLATSLAMNLYNRRVRLVER